jgi:hypothetical protein
LLALGFALGLAGVLSGGCSRQAEGERCDLAANGDDDCEEGLICVSKVGNVDRCCPPEGAPIDDSRCSAANAPSGGPTGGASSGGSATGGASTAGASSGGTSSGGSASGGTSSGGTSGGDSSTGGSPMTPAGGAGGEATGDTAGSGGQSESTAGASGSAN